MNSWVKAQELEEARSMLPIFQQSAGCLTGGDAPMPVKTLGEGIANEELGNESSPPLLAFSFPFFSFSLCSVTNSMAGIDIPRSEADIQVDLELPWIQGFLNTTCKLDDLDEAALKKFLKRASKFCVQWPTLASESLSASPACHHPS